MLKTNECNACGSTDLYKYCRLGKYVFYKCRRCGLVLFANPPSERQMNRFYSYTDNDKLQDEISKVNPLLGKFRRHSVLMKPAYFWGNYINKDRARAICKIFKSKKDLLDVGCGPGDFLNEMQKNHWHVYGTEIGDNLVIQAQSKIGKKNIYKGKINKLVSKLEKLKINQITLWHVFEHIYDIESTLKNLNKILQIKGWLTLEVPHSESLNFKLFKNKWTLLMVPQHLHFWNEDSLRLILKKFGYEIKKIEYPIHFPFIFASSIIKADKYMFILLPLILPFSVLISVFFSLIKRGDIIRVYAQKRS